MGVYDLNYGPVPATNPNAVAMQNYYNPQVQQAPPSSLAPTAGAGVVAPGMPGGSGLGTGLGMNLGTAQLALGGLGTIGNLWMAFNAQKLAKEQFNFQKDMTNANFANQIQSYNTSLADKINSRVAQEGGDTSQAQAYVDNNKLTDERRK